jgi:uncharacterized protein involved in cysteine biosynthesis
MTAILEVIFFAWCAFMLALVFCDLPRKGRRDDLRRGWCAPEWIKGRL